MFEKGVSELDPTDLYQMLETELESSDSSKYNLENVLLSNMYVF